MENERKDIRYQVSKGYKLQTLIHYVNKETLKKQHEKQQKRKATGMDGVSKEEYESNLESNLEELLVRMKKFSYKPKAVRRTYIPKPDGKLRPLGIPSYEDKLVQGCMAEILNDIYECKFLDNSYGFRPKKSAHDAIREVNQLIMKRRVNYILDCDIKGFFDNVNHNWLVKFLENDIEDKNFIRYIVRFLRAGIMKDMKYYESDKGTPQGGLISPVLANIYLHYVLDVWFKHLVTTGKIKGEAYIVRYADDFVVMFQYKEQAKKFYELLIERLKKFNLEISEDKTKIMPFGRFKGSDETFDFLGFMHYNGKTRTGKYTVGHKISKKKKQSKKQAINKWLKENRTLNILEIITKLNKKIVGLYAYYGINGMLRELSHIYSYARRMLYSVVSRRSQRKIKYEKYLIILDWQPIKKPKLYKDIWQWDIKII